MTAAGLPALAVLSLGLLAFAIALVAARWRRAREAGGGGRRDPASLIGIAVQGAAFVLVASGGARATLDPLGGPALAAAAITAVLMVGALALFLWSTATMGRNWSLVARTRADHVLVTAGPFAHLRHPIYTALALVVIAIAVATGHVARLLPALPVYASGTWLRVRSEERLLHALFGTDYERYAARVKRFVPGLF
ncbi:isoprenylcysteine carboxylmethyltransferase family protein [Sphingomonas sp. A2-49]|uniref:methyltransferase family protein n=1 Tax=Sphingomonas sp. A2-49 TaxID=1391375 RepID=UPI0021D12C90|nr:isoprenylcysteine carboxylmethyltransferase family protein [Sphingomonas sp. A2-49]MCU6453477.1 isoprenylcysteine carboxylmethyltransferase family protein [Sphingomonas sp. A2-49]